MAEYRIELEELQTKIDELKSLGEIFPAKNYEVPNFGKYCGNFVYDLKIYCERLKASQTQLELLIEATYKYLEHVKQTVIATDEAGSKQIRNN